MAASNEERRVVLIKPGDLLLIGNAGAIDSGAAGMLQGAFEALGVRSVIFAADIDLGLLPGGASDG